MDSSTSQNRWSLLTLWGLIATGALLFCDLKTEALVAWTDFARLYYPCIKSAVGGNLGPAYLILPGLPVDASQLGLIFKVFAAPSLTFNEMPCVLVLMRPLAGLDLRFAQAAWHACSLISIAVGTICVTRAAALLELDAEHPHKIGWAALSFAPVLMTLWLGQLGLVFGILPLALGYYLLSRNKPGLAGLAWGLLILKPAFLIVALTNVVAQVMAKRFRCLVGIISSAAIFIYAAYSTGFAQVWINNLSTFDAQPRLDPLLNISLSHTLLSFMPQAYRAQWQPIVLFVGVFIAFGGFSQLLELVRADDKKHEIVPFATMLGCLLVPILAPDLPFYDLTVLCFGGLVVHCIEWREHMEWRIHTLNRMHWLCVNLYLVLFYFARQVAHPAELIVLMLVFYMRMVEAIRFAAHTPAFDG